MKISLSGLKCSHYKEVSHLRSFHKVLGTNGTPKICSYQRVHISEVFTLGGLNEFLFLH